MRALDNDDGDEECLGAGLRRTVLEQRSYTTGGTSDVEHFFAPEQFVERLQSARTMETCCTHNMLRLTRSLLERNPMAGFADYYERAWTRRTCPRG